MAWYNTGNIALTNGSATVTGSGTNFLVGAQIGEALYAPDGKLYEIQTIDSATVITLASTYLGSTASAQGYQIIPTQSLVADLASDVTDLISDFANVRDYAGNGKFNDGAVGTPGITFTQDQDNGLYRIGSNNWALAAGGQKIVDISTSGIDVTGSVTATGTSVFASLDISGDIDVDGTTNLDIVDIDGAVDFASTTAHAGNATFADNAKAIFGAGSDLQIYHDGSNSYISDQGTGDLRILAADFRIRNAADDETMIQANSDADVSLWYNNSKKLATTNTGIDVTGNVTADEIIAESIVSSSSTNPRLRLFETDTTDLNTQIQNQDGDFFIKTIPDDASTSTTRLAIDHATGDISFYDTAGTSQSLFWDASAESLAIGDPSVITGLRGAKSVVLSDVDGGVDFVAYASDNGLEVGQYIGGFLFGNDDNNATEDHFAGMWANASNTSGGMELRFAAGKADYETDTAQMVLDTSGNLLVGTTSENPYASATETGAVVRGDEGILGASRSDGASLRVNRVGTGGTEDGNIAEFRSNGTTVGSIGATNGDLFIGTGDVGLWFQDGANAVRPFRVDTVVGHDNSISLGVATSGRFNDAFIVNGVTTGSDGNDKQDIETLSDAEQRVAVACKGLLRKWRWKDAVEAKGDDARIHFGIIAQDLQAAFEAEGLDAGRYAMFMSNTWVDEETGEERTRLGVRYHELLAFIIAAI